MWYPLRAWSVAEPPSQRFLASHKRLPIDFLSVSQSSETIAANHLFQLVRKREETNLGLLGNPIFPFQFRFPVFHLHVHFVHADLLFIIFTARTNNQFLFHFLCPVSL